MFHLHQLHSLTWWHFLLGLVAYQFLVQICAFQFGGFSFVAWPPLYSCLHPSGQNHSRSKRPLKQCTQGLRQGESFFAEEFWGLLSLDDEFSAIHKALFSHSPFICVCVCVYKLSMSTILGYSIFLIHRSILWVQDVENELTLKIAYLRLCTEWWKSISWLSWNRYAGGLICQLKTICRIFKVFRT